MLSMYISIPYAKVLTYFKQNILEVSKYSTGTINIHHIVKAIKIRIRVKSWQIETLKKISTFNNLRSFWFDTLKINRKDAANFKIAAPSAFSASFALSATFHYFRGLNNHR